MDFTITYYSDAVQEQILKLPDTLAARYVVLTRRMIALGPNLGQPHTRAFGGGLPAERTPPREREIAESRMKEVKRENA